MDILNQYIINKFIESFVFMSYLFFIFISIQTFFLWNNVDKNTKESIVTDSFVKKNCLYGLFLSLIVIFFGIFENQMQLHTFYSLFNMLVPIVLVLFSFEWYGRLKPYVSKLLPIELTDFDRLLKDE